MRIDLRGKFTKRPQDNGLGFHAEMGLLTAGEDPLDLL